jgi:hypothetical protein
MTGSAGYFDKAVSFIRSVGINVLFERIDTTCFLPGLSIRNGNIIVDRDQLKYPGDILHEAGHIAVVAAGDRSTLDSTTIEAREDNAAEEMMTIAWSYAVCIHLDIDPGFVFHEQGYKGAGPHIAGEFAAGRYFGVPMLQYAGMTTQGSKKNRGEAGVYPEMRKWVREA